jgi:hypothetical protein
MEKRIKCFAWRKQIEFDIVYIAFNRRAVCKCKYKQNIVVLEMVRKEGFQSLLKEYTQ